MSIISKETWDNLIPEDEKEKISDHYKWLNNLPGDDSNCAGILILEYLFGKDNLQPKPLTYEDVARELFKNGAWQLGDGYMNDEYGYFDESANETYSLNMTSQKQAEKLLAINHLLNVAKFLNKDWKPDWSDENNEFYTLGIDPDDDSVNVIEVNMQRVKTEIVYFHTQQLAEKAIQILGEDTVRLALSTDY